MVMIQIYVMCKEYDKALDEIEYALSTEALPTVNFINNIILDKELKELPRFKALAQKYPI